MRPMVLALVLGVLPSFALAQQPMRDGKTYATAKLGVIVPQHDDLEGFDNGFALEGAVGFRANENLALEFGIGRFSMGASASGFVSGIGTVTASYDIVAYPMLASVKVIAPTDKVELFGVLGGGVYFMSAEYKESAPGFGSVSATDSDTPFALHFGGGLNVRISPNAMLGAEVRYIVGKESTFDVSSNFNSLMLGAALAFSL